MSNILVAGANAPIAGEEIQISVRCRDSGTAEFAVAVLPLPSGADPWLPLQDPPPAYAEGARTGIDFSVKLAKLPASVQTVALALYASAGSTTLMGLRNVSVDVGGYSIHLENTDLAVATIVFAELYRRGGVWKLRAKKEGVFDGIEELGRRLGVQVTDRRKSEQPSAPTRGGPGGRRDLADWSGSGSLIADRYLVTNAHVVHGANEIFVSSFVGKSKAEAIIVDEKNDLALLRIVESFGRSELAFRTTGASLGETAITLGYPLHGLLGKGPQVTNGSISNLLGPGDDASVMQITCPIQPGSSGGPVFDSSGLLLGVVTATLSNAQNVNFAIRTALVMTLMEVADIDIVRRDKAPAIDVSEVVRANSKFVWRVECFR
jgi:S1-C subfamily serine protease